ncbi:MAG: lipopolysaccharide core heptose(I) kinase RfaP [Gammaproteobacteria bacterium]
MIYVRKDLQPLFAAEHDVEDFLAIQGELFKSMPGRHTLRFERGGRGFFIKAHFGVGWREIIKNLVNGRLPVLGAGNEWRAIHCLEQLQLATMRIAAYGEQGRNPARQRSFLVTEALDDTESLDTWLPRLMHYPDRTLYPELKRAVIHKVAGIARTLHTNGLNHRDFYLCHLRIDLAGGTSLPAAERLRIYLMDLHRVQRRRHTPRRWKVKDLGSLLYSALFQSGELTLTTADYARFVQAYSGRSLCHELRVNRAFWRQVIVRMQTLYRKTSSDVPLLPRFLEIE